MTTKTRLDGFLHDADLNVSAKDACHIIRDQIEVCRLAVIGLADGDDPEANAVASVLHDVADIVSALSEAPRLGIDAAA